MRKELRILFFGIVGSILVSGGTIAIAIGTLRDDYSYYPILVFFGGIMLIYAVFASLVDVPVTPKSQ